MSKIASVKNITIYTCLATASDFNQNVNIVNHPDECIVRTISYSGPATDTTGTYLIWSSLINDFIGSFVVNTNSNAATNATSTNARTVIKFQEAINNVSNLHFSIYTVATGQRTLIQAQSLLAGDLAISLDFIKYKK